MGLRYSRGYEDTLQDEIETIDPGNISSVVGYPTNDKNINYENTSTLVGAALNYENVDRQNASLVISNDQHSHCFDKVCGPTTLVNSGLLNLILPGVFIIYTISVIVKNYYTIS